MNASLPDDFYPEIYLAINPDVAAAGFDPIEHYILYGRNEGRAYKICVSKDGIESTSQNSHAIDMIDMDDRSIVAESGLFDENWYRLVAELNDASIDSIFHFLTVGEASGLNPSKRFDSQGYRTLNDDINSSKCSPLLHYLRFGQFEGRSRSVLDWSEIPDAKPSEKQTIVVIFHECSRTGAPILGLNIVSILKRSFRVFALVKRSGKLIDEVRNHADLTLVLPDNFDPFPKQCEIVVRKIIEVVDPLYVLANSVETRCFVPAFENLNIPTICLVHEFASYDWLPSGSLSELFLRASKIVFSSKMVAENCYTHYPVLGERKFNILPQGRSWIPSSGEDIASKMSNCASEAFKIIEKSESFIVVGLGRVTPRKGVDIFIETAVKLNEMAPHAKIVFMWIGGWDNEDEHYFHTQKARIKQLELEKKIQFFPEMSSLNRVYSRANLMLMSSRLDPLPNVAIDAACEGIPIVCFEEASGIAELLLQDEQLARFVIKNFDPGLAAAQILRVANEYDRREISKRMKEFSVIFNMENYVQDLNALITSDAKLSR